MSLGAALLWSWVLVTAPAPIASEPLAVAQEQFERGEYPAAIATLSSALAEHPQDARLFHWRSRCYLEQRDYAQAVADAERAVSGSPDDSEYRRWLGRAYGGAAEQARSFWMARKVRRAFEDAVRLDPSNLAARRDLAQFYVEAPSIVGGDAHKALAQVDAIAALDAVAGHLARAASFIQLKRFDEADSNYRRVLELRPERLDPYLELADFYETRRDAGELAEVTEQAARITPSEPALSYYRGVALVLAHEHLDEAEPLLRAYLETAPPRSDRPSHARTYEWLGRLNEQLGQAHTAADEYRAALALDPDRPSAREALRRLEASDRRGSQNLDRR